MSGKRTVSPLCSKQGNARPPKGLALGARSSTLAEQIQAFTPRPGIFSTSIPELLLVRTDKKKSRTPIVYDPCLYVVAQGCKRGFLGDEVYTYGALQYLVLSVPLPLECEVIKASPASPYLALKLRIDLTVLSELILQMNSVAQQDRLAASRGIYISKIDHRLGDCMSRLLATLDDDNGAAILGPMIVKEILFHLLSSEQGPSLRAFVMQDRHNYRVAQVIDYIQGNYTKSLEINTLADIANMSPSTLHQHFKSVTNVSPMQYIKAIRLHQARRIMLQDSIGASEAGYRVGYTSPSQFSREYKRLFGFSPSKDIERTLAEGV